MNGLKSLGKSNSGELEFKSLVANKKQGRSPQKTNLSRITEKTENSPAPSPRKKATDKTKRRVPSQDSIDEDEFISPKKQRSANNSRSPNRKTSSASPPKKSSGRSAGTSGTESSIVVNNHVTNTNGQKTKTYELNFELDISFDANVVVNVKRKPKRTSNSRDNTPKSEKASSSKKTSIASASTDEIPATEKSYAVGKARVYKKAVRTSPRAK